MKTRISEQKRLLERHIAGARAEFTVRNRLGARGSLHRFQISKN
jgi:hypothetical protein